MPIPQASFNFFSIAEKQIYNQSTSDFLKTAADEVIQSPNLPVTMIPARRATHRWIKARLLGSRKLSYNIGGVFGKEEGALIPGLHIGQERREGAIPAAERGGHKILRFDDCNRHPFSKEWSVRYMSVSARRERGMRENLRGATETTRTTNLHKEDADADDLDYYMKSQFDPDSLGEAEESSEEEIPAQCIDGKDTGETGNWKLKLNADGKFVDVVAVLGDVHVLRAAFESIKSRRRLVSLGEDDQEVMHVSKERSVGHVEDVDWNWFEHTAEQLRAGTYNFKPLRRIEVSRRGRGEPRCLTLVNMKDQIVQEAMKGILEKIYEPVFSRHAHGSRPGTSVHSALKSIKYGWKGITWFLQFDVRKSDDTLVQKRLMGVLAERIQDQRFLGTLREMFEVGIIRVDTFADEEMPKGSILSALLGSIYFHQLDEEINRIIEEVSLDKVVPS